jgi:hypothetical protein
MYIGEEFAVTSVSAPDFNGVFIVASIINATTFTYAQAGTFTPYENTNTATIAAVQASGTEVLQTNAGAGCQTTASVSTATGQSTACAISSNWLSPSGSTPLTTGTVRPPGRLSSYPAASNATSCAMSGFCQTSLTSVTVTTTTPFGLVANQQFYVSGASNAQFNGWFTVTSVTPATNQFTYTPSGGSVGNRGGLGVVQPSYVLLTTIASVTNTHSVTLTGSSLFHVGRRERSSLPAMR